MSVMEASAASIGKSVEIRGEVKGSEDLVIDGRVEGTLTLTDSRLTIGPSARVDADVAARDVIILGLLNGNVNATGRVELRKSGNLTGNIRAVRLSIEEGALVSGKVELTQAAAAISTPAVSGVSKSASGYSPTAP
jgi:cytoskeletal protein CcmA (bactofilin family)